MTIKVIIKNTYLDAISYFFVDVKNKKVHCSGNISQAFFYIRIMKTNVTQLTSGREERIFNW
jgi:hypothetical protein